MKKMLFSVILFLGMSSIANAQSDRCGIAGYFLTDNSILSSAARFVVNMTFFPSSTLGMTFGTSGCKKHTLVENERKLLHYVSVAKHDLMIQVAQGSGEHFDALSARFNCNWKASERFKQVIQRSYPGIFHSADLEADEIIERIQYYIILDPQLVNECHAGLS